mmetsp:Transcript_5257/g.5375  ORF Transcript_5257/g.5375 Transcript_5257/m.5375 type:complete len:129 (+) Transcript_5257:41-427(+)
MAELSFIGADKDQLVTSLATLVVSDSGVDVTAENINAVLEGSGNVVAPYWATLFANYIEKAGGVKRFFTAPGAGGGAAAAPAAAAGGAAPAASAAAAPAPAAKPKEEEVDALEGGMDMFGGGGGGGDY